MLLIMSNRGDFSTNEVIQWLLFYSVTFCRIDQEDEFYLERFVLDNNTFEFTIKNDHKRIELHNIKSVWYRRGELNFSKPTFELSNYIVALALEEHITNENKILANFFYGLIENIHHVGTFRTREVNKLEVLYQATRQGLLIPKSLICSNSETVRSELNGRIVTKAISEGFVLNNQFGRFMTYTESVDIDNIQDYFFPSLFQKEIEKEADVRTFYLKGKFFSMAIRSQEDSQTSTDFRKYLTTELNRCFPIALPAEYQTKLDNLMHILNLDNGSIDSVLTEDGQFYFLEVNPVGQFSMTSKPCNYYLERLISQHLIPF
jgi:ATP-GRASP peptide maturase of grasp-with-spasm system